jgi:hypothetical protein
MTERKSSLTDVKFAVWHREPAAKESRLEYTDDLAIYLNIKNFFGTMQVVILL